jgi:hypothetical protein
MSSKAVISLTTGLEDAELNGTIPLWQWIGQDHAVTFSY